MVGFALLVVVAAAGASDPDVRGDSRCPAPEEVARRLRPLLPADGELPTAAWLEIADVVADDDPTAGKQIEVRMSTGTPPRTLGVRRLTVPGSCDEAAQAVAVVAASWTASYLSPAPLWSDETPPVARPEVGAQATDAQAPALSRAQPPRSAPAGEARAAGSDAGRAPLALAVGATVGVAAAASGTAAPFVSAELDLSPRRAVSARLLVMAAGARTIELGSGQVAWRRLVAGAGIAATWGTPAVHLQIGSDVLAGATFMEGRGFAENASTTSFDAAIGPWVRAGARLAAAPVTVWVGAQGLAWAREQRVHVDLMVSRGSLPRLDLLAGAGLTWTPSVSNRPRP